MKRCPKCGAVSRRPGEKFCSKCGAPLSEVPPQAPGWPPESFVRRKRGVVVLTVAAVVVLILVLWVGALQLFGRSAQPADAPATVTAESAAATAVPGEADRLYLENLTEVPGLRITVNGVETTFAAAEDGRFRSRAELEAIYPGELGFDPAQPVIAYCRIGERSSHTWFVLKHLLGYENVRNYDGSWTEWGNVVGVPIVTGAEPGEVRGR